MSQVGKFLNLKPHMTNWGVYNENGPYTSAYTIGSLSPAQFGGLSYMILAEKGGDVYVIQTETYGRCAIWAPRDEDSTISYERVFSNGDSHGSGGGTLVPGTGGTGKYLNLKPHMTSWGVYNENGPYTSAYTIGSLAPAQFSGLSYMILAEKGGDVYVIQTETYGRCAIWAPRDNDSTITTSPAYSSGGTTGGTGGTGKYLNLNPHMTSWGVYNQNGPYTSANSIGKVYPAQFGGLSYEILAEKGGDVYVIRTESFGLCAIWAPRDEDSSITSSPIYTGTGTGGGSNPGTGIGGVEIPGGLKVFIDPGHGGSDPGAVGNGLSEKNIVLSIAKKVGVILNNYGVSVKYSREADTFVDLAPRAQMANNWGANLFVSIHANSASSPATGTECFTHPNDVAKTKDLSAKVALAISNKLGIPNRGHKQEDFAVLRVSSMPAILVETAFINSSDANLLVNRQSDFAQAIATEILKYLNVSLDAPKDPVELLKLVSKAAVDYCNKTSSNSIRDINRCILDYLRNERYGDLDDDGNDSAWKTILGELGPFVKYFKSNYPAIHNNLYPYIKENAKMVEYCGQTIDLAHLAATTLGYSNDIKGTILTYPVPNFWTGWGGDLATAMADVSKLKKDPNYSSYTEEKIAQDYVIAKNSSCSLEDINADIDSIHFAENFKTLRFDTDFQVFYLNASSSVRKKLILENDFSLKLEALTLYHVYSVIHTRMTGVEGFALPFVGHKLKDFSLYDGKYPTDKVIEVTCMAFAKYLYNL